MTALSLVNLSKHYSGASTAALDDLTLEVAEGEFLALLGPSGCGKTTALRIIAGLLDASSGDVRFDGQSVMHLPPEKRDAVMVFQNHLLFPHMTVVDNVAFGLRMRGVDLRVRTSRAEDMLSRVGLAGYGDRKPSELSGGQQQRVALARALVAMPKLLLLDEPLANLDTTLREEMRDLIRDLHREFRITTVLVTHDQQEAVALATRIALLDRGRLLQCDVPDAFYARPASMKVARFFGGRNFIRGESAGTAFKASFGTLFLDRAEPQATIASIRPENIVLSPAPKNSFQAMLLEKSFLGSQSRLRLRVGEDVLEALVSPAQADPLVVHTQVTISLPPERLILLPQS